MSDIRYSAQSGTSYDPTEDYLRAKYPTVGDSGKYEMRHLTYPLDLFGSQTEYGDTWVRININVLEQSKYAPPPGQEVYVSDTERRRFTEADARNQSVASTTANVAGSSAALAAILTAASGKNAVDVGINAARAGTVAAVGVGIPLGVAGTASRATKRIKEAIQLPMPNNIITPYTTNWGQEDTRIFDMMARLSSTTAGAVKDALGKGTIASGVAGDAAASLALSTVAPKGVSAAAGLASNPKAEMTFEGVDFRNFTFDYRFYPKSAAESGVIMQIIRTLKFHMYPEYKTESRFTYIYPSEFDITFLKGDLENPWLNKIATCALTNLSVNYTPSGVWATHEDGSPVMIQLTLTFKELSLLTKETIDKGY